MSETILLFTLAVVLVASVGLFAFAIHREKRRMHRQSTNLCALCGYDLRATEGECPECGAPPDVQKTRNLSAPLDPVKLHNDWPLSPVDPLPPEASEPLVAIYIASDDRIADLLAQQFEARGQWCSQSVGSASEVGGGMVRHFSVTTFSVPLSEQDRAQAIIDYFLPLD